MKKALIIVDLQNDFMEGGSLAVPEANQVIPVANNVQHVFEFIIATKDWHPENHGSFASNHPHHQPGDVVKLAGLSQILWPNHCVQNTKGAEFVAGFNTQSINKIFYKGIDPQIDSYSAFFDNAHRRSTGLSEFLQQQGIEEIYLLGVATDYCVKYSVLDACQLGLKVYLIEDGCRGVNLHADDSLKAFAEMEAAGAIVIHSKDLIANGQIS